MKNHRGGLPCGWRREASKELPQPDILLSSQTYVYLALNGIFPITYPPFLQFSPALCSLRRGHAVQTPMRTFIVIEVYSRFYRSFHFRDTSKLHIFKKFILNGIIYPFGYGIFLGVSIFSHAYADSAVFQAGCIGKLAYWIPRSE